MNIPQYFPTYYNPKVFNGVLFILREANAADNPTASKDEVLIGSQDWVKEVLSGTGRGHRESYYRNRFNEMLLYCGKSDLSATAYANVNSLGGGSKCSKGYNESNKAEAVKAIVEQVKPQYVFLCADIFNDVIQKSNISNDIIMDGLFYNGNKILKSFIKDGIVYYSIYHPSRSPKIVGINPKSLLSD